MFSKRTTFIAQAHAIALFLLSAAASYGLTINRTSDSAIYIDTSANVYCSYASYQIINNDGVTYSNLWAKIDTFVGTYVKLGGGDPGQVNVGTLANNQTNTVFFYLAATNITAVPQTHIVNVYRGVPPSGTLLTNQLFSLTVSSSGQNSSQTITSSSIVPNPATLGGIFTVTETGNTGTIGGPNRVNFTPSVYTNWDAASYQLVGTLVKASGGNTGTYTNTLVVTFGTQVATAYTNTYYFRAVAVANSNSISPLSIQSGGGGNFTHAPPPAIGVIPPIQPATNMTLITNFANVTQLYTNEVVTFTVRFSNSSTNAVLLDTVVDTLPAGFTVVSGSSKYNGAAILDPSVSGRTLTWSDGYSIPGASSQDLTFQAVATTNGYATNSVVAYSQSTVVDTTLTTSDNSPATSSVRVLLAPIAVNDSGTTFEDTLLTISAPGVLANDNEPNGFGLTVLSYTQPAHGSVTVNANGSYNYQPAQNYNGSDSFTYTITNGNGRTATAIVNLTVTPVNDAPTITALANLTINESAGLQTANLSGIGAGPADESSQLITVTATSSNPGLIPNPTVVYVWPATTGSLLFTPNATSNGVAVITVVVKDNGGTANGGADSVTNSFSVTVNPVNNPPGFTKGADQTILEDAGAQTVSGWATAISAGPPNESSQLVTFHVSNNNNGLFAVQPAVSSNGTLTYTPATNAYGSALVTVYLQDDGGTANGGIDSSVSQGFTITVTPVNDAPTLNPLPNLSLLQNAGLQTVNLSGISPGPANEAGQLLIVSATSSNPGLIPNPVVSYISPSTTGSLTFTPTPMSNGVAIISVVVKDNGGTLDGGVDSVTNIFTVTVSPANNAPSFTKGANQTVLEDAGAQTASGWATGISAGPPSESSQNLTFHVSNDNNGLFAVQPAVSPTGTLTYTPAANANGSATVSVYLQDDGGTANGGADTSSTQTFTISITAVNDAPTLNTLYDISIIESATEQTVNLSGISVGPANESGQALSIAASSSNPALIPDPNVSYFSPNSTGILTFAPAANSVGSAVISVIVRDDGGVANGGINSITNTFTVTVNPLTNSWASGLQITNTVTDADGAPGVGYSQLNLTGSLNIDATTNDPVTIHLLSLDGNVAGLAANFSYTNGYVWTILTTTRGITGFDPSVFAIDTTGFSNDLAGGTFNLSLSSDSNSLVLTFVPDHAPIASSMSFGRPWGTTFQISVADLLGNSSDSDGDAVELVSVTSTNGTTAMIVGSNLSFTFTNNLTEALTYTIKDSRPYRTGDTLQVSSNLLTLSVTNAEDFTVTVLGSGYDLTNTVTDATGAPEIGYSQIHITGKLDIQSTSNSPAVIHLVSLADTLPGLAANFYYTQSYSWTVLTTTRGVLNFDPANFAVDTASFSNDLAGGIFSASLSSDSNSIVLNFTPDHAPVANSLSYGRSWGTTFEISVSELLAANSDPDGDGMELVSVIGTNGTVSTIADGVLSFVFTNNLTENLSYTIKDARNYRSGDTIQQSTNLITISVTNAEDFMVTTWDSTYDLTNTINDATGSPGIGYSQINVTGKLSIQADSNSPAVLHLISLNGISPGLAANFGYTNGYSWTVVTTTRGVIGFDPATLSVESSEFSNDLAGGVFSLSLSVDSNSIVLNFIPNHAPTANSVAYGRPWGTAFQIAVSDLLGGSSDPDGDTLELVSVTSTNGTASTLSGGELLLTFTNNITESLVYAVKDSRSYRAGDTVQISSNVITLTVTNAEDYMVTVLGSGEGFTNAVNDATGLPSIGYSQIEITGKLEIEATSENPAVLHLLSLEQGAPGVAANFDYTNGYSWTVITTTRGVLGFDPAVFAIDTTQFSNDLAGGTFILSLSPDSNSIVLQFLPNHAPVANSMSYGRAWDSPLQVAISDLLSGSSDPDGDAVELLSISSTNGATATISGDQVYFTFTNNISEYLTYRVRDARNYRSGDTILSATNSLRISTTNAPFNAVSIARTGSGYTVVFTGVPGILYDVERTTNLLNPTWTPIATTNAPLNGLWETFDGDRSLPAGFYRARRHLTE